MTLCVCFGIVEGLVLFCAGLLPFGAWLRSKLTRKKCEHKPLIGKRGRRIPYVTSTDVIKMSKRDNK